MTLRTVFKHLYGINIFKTIIFNFYYFSPKAAIRLPIFIYKHTKLQEIKGKISIEVPITTGMLKIGPHCLGTRDCLYSRTIWELSGLLIIKGKASIGSGCKINVGKEAILTFGNNLNISGNSEIICQKEITFGNNCLLSWDILMMDTDFHHIINNERGGEVINPPKPIKIGNHVWIGCRNTILKGVSIADNNIIAANSTLTHSITNENCIIGGNGKILKTNINWKA